MPYNFVSEDDKSFKLSNGDSEFSVAKYGLDDGFMEQLRALPRAYQNGGMVEKPEPSAIESTLRAQTPINDIVESIAAPVGEAVQMGLQAPTSRALSFPAYGEFGGQPPPFAGPVTPTPTPFTPEAPPGRPPLIAPSNQPPDSATQMPGYYDMMQRLMQEVPGKQPEIPSDMSVAYEEMKKASMMDATAKADAALEQQRILDESAKDLQLEQLRFDTRMNALTEEQQKLTNDVQTAKIDPTRIYDNMSTGNRVLAGISILLGGLGQGLTGAKSNPAMDVINNAIDRDIDAQKANLGKKQNLLSINLAKMGDLRNALAATKMQMMTVANTQVQAQAMKAGSKSALAAAQMFQGQMDLDMSKLKYQIASAQAMEDKLNQPEGISAKDASKLPQDLQDKMVQLPNGNYMPAWNKESATEVKKKQVAMYPILSLLQEANAFMDQGGTLLGTVRDAKADELRERIKIQLKNLYELGQLTKGDEAIINPLLPNLGDFFNAKARQTVKSIQKQVNDQLNASYSAHVPGLNPAGRASREQSVFKRGP